MMLDVVGLLQHGMDPEKLDEGLQTKPEQFESIIVEKFHNYLPR